MPRKPPPLPSPAELGFPPKFQIWYPDQLEAIDRIVLSKQRFVALAMPTGAGKSVTGIAAALLHTGVKRAVYLTSTKGLQDQLAADFQGLGLIDLRGASNYPCIALQPGAVLDRYRRGTGAWTSTCDDGPCHSGVACPHFPDRKEPYRRSNCLYYGQVWDARRAPFVSTNYAMYLANSAYAEGLGDIDLLILDEAHDADKELENFLTVEIGSDDVRVVHSKFLKGCSLDDWKGWAIQRKPILASEIEASELIPPATPEDARARRHAKAVLGKISQLAEIDPLDWVLDENGTTAKFCPMKVSAYAESVLFRGIKHVVLMSATLTRKTTQLLGINPNDLSFWEAPSRFPVERRPIISVNTVPIVRVNIHMDADDKETWMRRIDRLIEPRRDLGWKGIIHTVSYQRMKELIARSEHRDWMIVHDSGGTREAIRRFKQSDGPYILVSPSIITGYDFPHDECRYQIIGKIPILDTRSPITKTRTEIDKEYAGYVAMQKLVQACGRGMRGPDDWCETFIVDDVFADYFYKYNRKHSPRWFQDAVEYVDTYPEPLLVA